MSEENRFSVKPTYFSVARKIPYPDNLITDMLSDRFVLVGDIPKDTLFSAIEKALPTLNDKERCVLELRFARGLSFAKIGTILGLSGNRAAQILNVAMSKLRNPLRNDGLIAFADEIGL